MNRRFLLSLPLWAWAPLTRSESPGGDAAQNAASAVKTSDEAAPPNPEENLATREDVRRWATDWAKERNWDAEEVIGILAQAIYQPDVSRAVIPPGTGLTAKSWTTYRSRYLDAVRIRTGTEFARQHAQWLAKAVVDTGVPPEIVLGILGVETIYGRHTGNYRALDSLATLAFNFPTGRTDRSGFFRAELGELFLLTQRTGLPITGLRGSFAGALGLPQFMPSSWNRFGVDGDGDGRIDLLGSVPDAIASVSHFLSRHGWDTGQPVYFNVTPPSDPRVLTTLLQPDILPTFTAEQLLSMGAKLPDAARQYRGRMALIELKNGNAAPSYVLGTQNFYVVTRYNWSSYYAMAVIELGQTIVTASRRAT